MPKVFTNDREKVFKAIEEEMGAPLSPKAKELVGIRLDAIDTVFNKYKFRPATPELLEKYKRDMAPYEKDLKDLLEAIYGKEVGIDIEADSTPEPKVLPSVNEAVKALGEGNMAMFKEMLEDIYKVRHFSPEEGDKRMARLRSFVCARTLDKMDHADVLLTHAKEVISRWEAQRAEDWKKEWDDIRASDPVAWKKISEQFGNYILDLGYTSREMMLAWIEDNIQSTMTPEELVFALYPLESSNYFTVEYCNCKACLANPKSNNWTVSLTEAGKNFLNPVKFFHGYDDSRPSRRGRLYTLAYRVFGKDVTVGWARCSAKDTFSKRTGRIVAQERLGKKTVRLNPMAVMQKSLEIWLDKYPGRYNIQMGENWLEGCRLDLLPANIVGQAIYELLKVQGI